MTGRLISADALYTLFVKMKSFGELTAKKAIRCVEEAPTVDAIPVEYIERTMNRWKEIIGYEESVEALRILIDNWKIERKEE